MSQSVHILAPDFSQNRLSNFYFSFLSLPEPKREAIETIYAFCRYTDDIVDEENADAKEKHRRLRQMTSELRLALSGASNYPILNKLGSIIRRFNIPVIHFQNLLKGMEMDLRKSRYETFEELEEYCYRVASTVGLICAEVFGYHHSATKEYAINLGKALQLTNILRDIKADAKRGRIYLPREDMRRFGYSEKDLLENIYNERFVELMRYECDRAHAYFKKAKTYLAEDDKPLFTAARTMGNIYYLLLRRIRTANYDVFSKRIRLGSPVKLLVAFVLRLRTKLPKNFHNYVRTELPA
ncbi:MAG TPA: phytoene/squalene synthase family protein [Bacteroidota bacterium]|nr:phytoene/squalene synthase family protein [Bacteroidota bacterium]